MHSHPGKIDGNFAKAAAIAIGLAVAFFVLGQLFFVVVGIGLVGLLGWAVYYVMSGSTTVYSHPAKPIVGNEQHVLRDFEELMQRQQWDDERAAWLWQRLSPLERASWKYRYDKRAAEAASLAEVARAQAEAIKREMELGDALFEREVMRETRRTTK